METYVVDASVGAKWFFSETGEEAASYLLQCLQRRKMKLIVPDFFYIEIGNVCRNRVRKKEINSSAALAIMDHVAQFPIARYPDGDLWDVAFENAIQFDISVYDALYIALAEIYTVPLITADEVLVKICKNRFDFILSLSELKPAS